MMIFPLITFPYTSRILGPAGTGKISFATSFVNYFVILSSIGIPLYGIREIARVRDNKEALSITAQELFIMHLITSIAVFFCFLILIFLNGKLSDEKALFIIVSFSIILTTFGMEWLYQGLEEYTYITVRSLIFSTISVIAVFIFIHNKEDYVIAATITVFASLGSSVLNFYNARKILFVRRVQPWNFKRHIKPLSIVYMLNFINSIYVQLDTVILGFMSTAISVGYYAAAMKMTKMLVSVVNSLGSVLLPRLSFYIANNLNDDFDKLIKKSLSVILIICLPIVAAFMMLSKETILVIAGGQFLPAAQCMVITAPIIMIIGLANIMGIQILYPLGKDMKVVYSIAAGAIVSVILNVVLIPHYQQIGAAYAALIAEFFVLAVMYIMVSKIYTIKLPFNNILKYIIATLVLVGLLAFIKYSFSLLWLRLIVAIPSGVLVYTMTLLLLKESFSKEILLKLRSRLF